MKFVVRGLIIWTALVSSALAETVYVTDMLQLDLYATEAMTGGALVKLRSGDRLEVLERNGRIARVRADGGEVGWVKALYLVEEEPARTRVNQLEQANEKLENTVEQLRGELSDARAAFAELEASQSGAAEARAAKEAELQRLSAENARLQASLNAYAASVPASWASVALLVALLCGLAGGWYIIDRRSRSRHGGYRVY